MGTKKKTDTKKTEKRTVAVAVDAVLANWRSLNEFMAACTEDEAAEVLQAEKDGAKRLNFLLRCHSRMNVLRGRREVEELRAVGVLCK